MHVPLQLCPILIFWVASLVDFVGKLPLLATRRHSQHYLLHILGDILAAWGITSLYLFITSRRQKFPVCFGRLVFFKLRFRANLFGLFFLFECLYSYFWLLFLPRFVERIYWRSNIGLKGALAKLLHLVLHLFPLVLLLLFLMVQDEQVFNGNLSVFEVQINFLILQKLS